MDEILASIRRIISDDPAPSSEADDPPAVEAAEKALHDQPMPETPPSTDEPLVSDAAASASASAFDALAASAQTAAAARTVVPLPAPGRTLEDLTADLLRPLLKTWLDENLPDIVRDRVDEEVRRIARSRVR